MPVALATGAVAQKPKVPLNTLKAIQVALQTCWIPPPINQARPGMQITVMMSFNRNGELFGQPKITFESVGASNDERLAYRIAVAWSSSQCPSPRVRSAVGADERTHKGGRCPRRILSGAECLYAESRATCTSH
jgi:hypothetical protein